MRPLEKGMRKDQRKTFPPFVIRGILWYNSTLLSLPLLTLIVVIYLVDTFLGKKPWFTELSSAFLLPLEAGLLQKMQSCLISMCKRSAN